MDESRPQIPAESRNATGRGDAAEEAEETHEPARGREQGSYNDTTRPRTSRIRLKTDKSSRHHRSQHRRHRNHQDERSSSRAAVDDERYSPRRKPSRRHRHRRHGHGTRSPTPPNPHEPPSLDPEAAFRESLFDAMADDEGASYWESVYGQPIHVYPSEKVGPSGELEQMTDDEYAAYVRAKMWEKTHAGLLEERARRREKQKRQEEEERRARKLRRDMEQSLRRGQVRREKKEWATRWQEYAASWAVWDGDPAKLSWPVVHDQHRGVNEKDVRSFFIHALDLESTGEQGFLAKLKEERVRWHPDKIQQKLGGTVDPDIMRDVTATFQSIDRLWGDIRQKTPH
ncbi:hypothetical protein UVI_02038540 [Ustilaginoidea virens]|nr:hypothetical protein UVI_02038540 [Ustilaginoidea virens]